MNQLRNSPNDSVTGARNRGAISGVHFELMRLLEKRPGLSQRDAARELGVSLGKVNYCLRALIKRGWVKASNFKNSQNKAAYLYILTPRGLTGKAQLAVTYLQQRMREFDELRRDIEQIPHDGEETTRIS
jgi:EPS-associated MarR family transcriptional regulator